MVKTNQQVIRELLKHPDLLVFVRERLITSSAAILEREAELREEMKSNDLITADYWLDLAKRTHDIVKFS